MCVNNEDIMQLYVELVTFFNNLSHYKYVVDCGSVRPKSHLATF